MTWEISICYTTPLIDLYVWRTYKAV